MLQTGDTSLLLVNNLDKDFFSDYEQEYGWIKNHIDTYGNCPDIHSFLSKFPNFDVIQVNESNRYLLDELYEDRNKRHLAKVFNKVRALNPEPYAYIILNDEEMKIIDGYIGCESNAFIGSICDIKKDAIGIKCLDKVFYVTEVKPFGKKKMKVQDYLNGVNKEKLKDSIVK